MKTTHYLLALVSFFGLSAALVQATEPFEMVATTTSGPAITISASGSNLVDFTNNLINTKGQFQALNNTPFHAVSTFLGVPNAITYDSNAGGTNVTLALNPIGFTKTFTGATSSDVNNQIKTFYESNGSTIYANFLKAIAQQSAAAVTDGNPNAATAQSANGTFTSQGFTSTDEIVAATDETGAGSAKPRLGGFGIGFNAGQFKAAGMTGTNTDFSFSGLNIGLGDKVRLLTPINLDYLKIEGAKVYGGGINLALPVRLQAMDKTNPWNWRLTPLAGLNVRGSEDLASGGLLWDAGLVNSIDYRVSPQLVVCVINQATEHKSMTVSYGSYHFNPNIDQQILKNGVRAVVPITRRVIVDGFVVETNFLKSAAVKQFTTFGGSVSLRTTKSYNLSLGANYDTGSNFKAWSVGLSSAWHW
jgi:hypothetical protein